jgi:hypothetical protein
MRQASFWEEILDIGYASISCCMTILEHQCTIPFLGMKECRCCMATFHVRPNVTILV